MVQPELFPQVTLEELEEMAVETILKAKERFKPVATYALFSGGNDSTASVYLARNYVDAAVHIDTGIGISDEGRTALDHVRACCEVWELPLIVLRTSPEVYRHIVLRDDKPGGGFPARHDITYHLLKNQRLQEFQRDKSKRGEMLLFVTGVRKSESVRRSSGVASKPIDEPRGRLTRCAWANPIIGFAQAHLASLREKANLPQCDGAALIHKSGECLCGAFPQPFSLEELSYWFPTTGKYIRSLEVLAEKAGKPYCRWGRGHDKDNVPAPGPLCSSCELFKDLKGA